jgi:hypothetical protein
MTSVAWQRAGQQLLAQWHGAAMSDNRVLLYKRLR